MIALILPLLLLTAQSSAAEHLDTPQACADFAQSLVTGLATGDAEAAMRSLRAHYHDADIADPAWNELKTKLLANVQSVKDKLGPAKGVERIAIRAIGDSLIEAVLLEKHAKLPLRWVVLFYRAETSAEYRVIVCQFDDKLSELVPFAKDVAR